MSALTAGTVGVLTFAADATSLHFAGIALLVWLAVTIYAVGWFEGGSRGFHLPSLAALAAVLGVIFAGDLLTLFVFFELLALLGFLLVRMGDDARGASIRYFWTMVVGGLVLLAGIFLQSAGAAGPASALLVLGFGVKAGMLPVHGWLPSAHAKAPPPASALLSGAMIKVGIYGIVRVMADPATLAVLPLVLLTLGLVGALYGATLALVQTDAKRLLAWSSVSQIGVILTGIGAGAWEGSLAHVATHASAKAALFLAVGTVLHRTGTVQLPRLGGLWRAMPITCGLSLLAGGALMGLPVLRASAGKGEIHHALTGILPAEAAFFLASVGTSAVILRLLVGVFFGPQRREAEAPAPMWLATGIVAAPLLIPTMPGDIVYFGATAGLGAAVFLLTRRWSPLRSSIRFPQPTLEWRLPRPTPPPFPEARLQRAAFRYARETEMNLALLFVVLLAAMALLR